MKKVFGKKCWYGDRPGVVIGGSSANAYVRFLDGRTARISWSNLQPRNGEYWKGKLPYGGQPPKHSKTTA